MPAGLQVYDDRGYIVVDTSKRTLILYLQDIVLTGTSIKNNNQVYVPLDYGSPVSDLFITIKTDVGPNPFVTYNGNYFYLYSEGMLPNVNYKVTLGVYQL